MKKWFVFLLIFYLGGLANENGTADQKTIPDEQVRKEENAPAQVQKWSADDFKKFYIGVSRSPDGLKLITLDITEVDWQKDELRFHYVMNSQDTRRDGEGMIFPDQNIIQFNPDYSGRILRTEDGKIVFESLKQDSLNYWKIEEK